MDSPLLYDLFSGAGGAGAGYYRAGFRVIGIDNDPKPLRHYPFESICMDALEFLDRYNAGEFERAQAFHASPPCQYYSRLRHLPWLKTRVYWRSVPPTLERMNKLTVPWVLENVEDCWDMPESVVICGNSIGLSLYRHRRFLITFPILLYPHQKHNGVITPGRATLGKRHHGMQGFIRSEKGTLKYYQSVSGVAGHFSGIERARIQMGIDWMNGKELSQAIPPSFTEYIGGYLIKALSQEVEE